MPASGRSLKRVEEAGIEAVILYFNVGGKPHAKVMAQMAQCMSEVAPHFDESHKTVVKSTV